MRSGCLEKDSFPNAYLFMTGGALFWRTGFMAITPLS